MADWKERLGGLPDEWARMIDEMRNRLPPMQRARAEALLDRLPIMPKSLRALYGRVYDRARTTFDTEPLEIAVIGPVNSGKSTLINALTGARVAEVSPIPGTTRRAQWVSVGPFHLADTPGMDEAGGEDRSAIALETAKKADLLLLLLDASAGVTESHRRLHDTVQAIGKPTIVVLNKIDLVRGYEEDIIRSAEQALGREVIAVSAKTGRHLGEMMKGLAVLDSRVLNIMSDLLPEFQGEVARQRVASASAMAAAVAWEPLPIADMIPLAAIQALMVLEIGKLYGYPVSLVRARELMATFAGGMALREGFRQVAKLIPGAGGLVSSAYAAAGTAAMGAAAIAWFESGGSMSEKDIRALYRESLKRFREILSSRRRKESDPDRNVESEVERTLRTLPRSVETKRGPDGDGC